MISCVTPDPSVPGASPWLVSPCASGSEQCGPKISTLANPTGLPIYLPPYASARTVIAVVPLKRPLSRARIESADFRLRHRAHASSVDQTCADRCVPRIVPRPDSGRRKPLPAPHPAAPHPGSTLDLRLRMQSKMLLATCQNRKVAALISHFRSVRHHERARKKPAA